MAHGLAKDLTIRGVVPVPPTDIARPLLLSYSPLAVVSTGRCADDHFSRRTFQPVLTFSMSGMESRGRQTFLGSLWKDILRMQDFRS